MKPVSVFDFIQELVTTVEHRIRKEDIDLILDTPTPNTDFDVMMDKTMLFGACLAILENAVDACVSVKNDREILTIQIQVTNMSQQVVFKFRDNGKGLDREYRQKIFSLFFSDKGKKAPDWASLLPVDPCSSTKVKSLWIQSPENSQNLPLSFRKNI